MDCLENYSVLSSLGQGSYASVRLARRRHDNKLYALKKISFMDSTTRDKKAALNEVRLLASINCEHIVAFKSAFFEEDEQILYIVMEYAERGDLASKIEHHREQQTRFREEEIWKMLYHISKALKILHQNRIIHRDLKPANIVECTNEKFKLVDLNISRKIRDNELVDTMIGTPSYLSPEVWKRDQYDCQVDMWSLGVIAYEMALLELPFPAQTMEELFKKVVLHGKYKRVPAYYSEQLGHLISELMHVEANRRPSPCEVMSRCLYSTFKCTADPPHSTETNSTLLSTMVWPNEPTNMLELLPKSQYDDQLHTRPDASFRTTARSFRLRTNTFLNRIDQSPKNGQQRSQLGKPARRKSYRQPCDQPLLPLQDLSRRILNDATQRMLQVSAKQIVLKPPLLRKGPPARDTDR